MARTASPHGASPLVYESGCRESGVQNEDLTTHLHYPIHFSLMLTLCQPHSPMLTSPEAEQGRAWIDTHTHTTVRHQMTQQSLNRQHAVHCGTHQSPPSTWMPASYPHGRLTHATRPKRPKVHLTQSEPSPHKAKPLTATFTRIFIRG